LLNRPIIRISVIEKDGNAGHVLHYNPQAPNRDDLTILAAGRAVEQTLLGDVFEHGRIDWARRNGLKPNAEPIGVTTGYLRPETMR
jgi:hypothetical protein